MLQNDEKEIRRHSIVHNHTLPEQNAKVTTVSLFIALLHKCVIKFMAYTLIIAKSKYVFLAVMLTS